MINSFIKVKPYSTVSFNLHQTFKTSYNKKLILILLSSGIAIRLYFSLDFLCRYIRIRQISVEFLKESIHHTPL